MKKVLLTLGLVAGMVTNAQQFAMGTIGGVVAVARVTKDSRVYVTTHKYGTVLSADTLHELPSNFRYDQGYRPLVLTPQTNEAHHEHKHEMSSAGKNTLYFGGIVAGTYGFYKFLMWVSSSSKTSTPTYYSGGQCSAIAASTGQRCKRNRESGSIYCWQHK